MELTNEEQEKACRIGVAVARQHSYQVRDQGVLGRVPSEERDVLVVVIPTEQQGAAHVVLQVAYDENAERCLHTLDVHMVSRQLPASECAHCDVYYQVEEAYVEYYDEEEFEREHLCEGGDAWHDGDKGGFEPCSRTDTAWYEFWVTGSAGFYCPSHWPYESDMALLRRQRERAERQKAQEEERGA